MPAKKLCIFVFMCSTLEIIQIINQNLKKKIGVDVDPQFKEMEAEQESLGGLHQEGHPATKYAKTN